jgi:predicted nucleic acid-binding protein
MRLKNAVVLDTDVASFLWRGKLEQEQRQKLIGHTAVLTFVTVAEFWQGAYKANWDQQQIRRMTDWYSRYELIAYDFDIVKTWGRLSGLARQSGIIVPANDCWIAACCVSHSHPLLTRNAKHFKALEPYGLQLF